MDDQGDRVYLVAVGDDTLGDDHSDTVAESEAAVAADDDHRHHPEGGTPTATAPAGGGGLVARRPTGALSLHSLPGGLALRHAARLADLPRPEAWNTADRHERQQTPVYPVPSAADNALIRAASSGAVEEVRALLAAGEANVDARKRRDGRTPLHIAATRQHAAVAALLIDHGSATV